MKAVLVILGVLVALFAAFVAVCAILLIEASRADEMPDEWEGGEV